MNPNDVVNIRDLTYWLEGENPVEEYNYSSNKDCLISQFLRYNCVDFESVGAYNWADPSGNWIDLPKDVRAVVLAKPWTFGAAYIRAKFVLSIKDKIEWV